ncbi:MAG: PTS sugar transporter subunit IIA [Rhodothermaceae bacterium]|nr:PTS sugar transporter subunit IIA [Rhodothermaceae bacterium]
MVRIDDPSVAALLAPERIQVGLPEHGKDAVIGAVVDLLAGAPEVIDLARVSADVFEREAVMSTGVGKGLALPHARTPGVNGTVAAFAVTEAPVDYGALDGVPVRLVFLLVGPDTARGTHLHLLGRISRLMNDDAFRTRLTEATDAQAVLACFEEAEEHLG